ncbi:MAG: hypothetical protein HY646_13765 [Acidobacteria bacterium]|nr:hypothetical protein [Acidobacteriota bacterium]
MTTNADRCDRFDREARRRRRLGRLKEALVNYTEVAEELAHFGACDTEPRCYFEQLIMNALRGQKVQASGDPRMWELYCSMPGVAFAARKLGRAAQQVLDVLTELPLSELESARTELAKFCSYADVGGVV